MKKRKNDEQNKEKRAGFLEVMRSNFYMMGLVYKACPSRVIGQFAGYGAMRFKRLFFSVIFWEVVLRFIEERAAFLDVLPFLVFSVLLYAVSYFIQSLDDNIIKAAGNHRIYEKLHLKMFAKATDVELECFENPEFYNKYMKAANQIKSRAHTVIWTNALFVANMLAVIYMIIKTISIDAFAIVFAIVPVVSTSIIGKKINQLGYDLYQINLDEGRKQQYVKRTLYQKEFAKELRMSNGFTLLMDYFHSAVDMIIKNTKKYGLKIGILSCLQSSMGGFFVNLGSIVYATLRLIVFKDIRVSEYIVLINIIGQISYELGQSATMVNRFYDNHLYIKNIREFFDYKPKISESQKGKDIDKDELLLKMEDVSFKYLGQDREVLHNINLSIKKKEKIVLVGENGAGKSTLIKLLMRLYDPSDGKITLNGENIKAYDMKQYRSLFGTVFQDYKVFGLTVAENVLTHRMREDERTKVEEALKYSGLYDKIMTLPNGIDSTITREFDPEGVVLSGGENQKLAIARVFAKDCEIAILDEPSSALDAIAEYKMYESMLKACEDKAVVFISHRLSSAVLADRIYMLENGMVVEVGTHDELMKKNGKYAKMFRFQADNYVKEEAV